MQIIRLAAAFLICWAPMWGQLTGFSNQERLKYTKLSPFPRFPDGSPKISEEWLRRLGAASSEEGWVPLVRAGYLNQWEGGWQILHGGKKLIGRAFTAQFMQERPDVNDIIEADAKAAGLAPPAATQRVIDMLQPGDVMVVDVFGKIEEGGFGGDNLATAIYAATGNGYVVNGSLRDLEGIYSLEIPIYVRGFHPSSRAHTMLTGINVPVRIGSVTVMPGDVVLGDREGLSFIPPHLVPQVVEHAELSELHDEWTKEKFKTRKYKSSDLYPSPKDPVLKKEYEEWLARKKAELGRK